MPVDLDTSLLRTLVAIADTGSFSRASARLNITQSAVTLRVQKLEGLVRAPLVLRHRTGVTLTSEGRALESYARRIIETHDEVVEQLINRQDAQTISIGVIEEFERFCLRNFLTSFHRKHPRARIDVVVDYSRNLKRLLEDGEIRLAILKRSVVDGEASPLYRDPMVWAVAPDVAAGLKPPIPLVVSPEPCVNRAVMLHALDAAGVPWRIVSCSPTLSGVLAAVNAGLGVTALDLHSVQPDMRILTPQDGFPPLPESDIAMVRRRGPPDRLLDRFARRLESFMKTLPLPQTPVVAPHVPLAVATASATRPASVA